MKCFPRWLLICLLSLFPASVLICGLLSSRAENSESGSATESALYRLMNLPAGAVLARRLPSEGVEQVGKLIRQSPTRGDLYAIRAQEEERQLDAQAAENDWKRAAKMASNRAPALIELADFYHRRLKSANEADALVEAAKLPETGLDRFRPDRSQRSWHAFERAVVVAKEANLPFTNCEAIYNSWIDRYPKSPVPYLLYLDVLAAAKDTLRARTLADRVATQFPQNTQLQMQSEAKLASIDSGPSAELDTYSRRFTPLWPAELRARYYDLLKTAHQLRSFLAQARSAVSQDAKDLRPVLRIYFYYEQESKRELADKELLSWELRRNSAQLPPNGNELATVAPLFERVGDYDESARAYYTIYESSAATQTDKELALSSLIKLLLDVPEQPLRLGSRDLSLYRNVGRMDPHPGFLNGILSIALNTTSPQYEYQMASQAAATYFHRAAASNFLEKLKQQFPNSPETGALEAKLFEAYAAYGQNDVLIRLIPAWLKSYPNAPEHVNAALLLADAYSATNRQQAEFTLYDHLLSDLAARSDGVPLGPELVETVGQQDSSRSNSDAPVARSNDYARVLDRYLSRLAQAQRLLDAVALYRREIDRNPGDPGLYERLALFIEQNRLDAQLARTYSAAFDRFKEVSWADKLARLYLRQKQYAAYQALARQITQTFDGSELASFVTAISPDPKISPVLYRQINLYAHRRFPHNLTFVRNLLAAYQAKQTADPGSYEKLLRENWFYDAGLRVTFFEFLSRTGKLAVELARLPALEQAAEQENGAAIEMRAEGLAWFTRFEAASPAFVRLAGMTPGDRSVNTRAVTIERSLASSPGGSIDRAVALAEQGVEADLSDSAALTRVGEIYADQELYGKAVPWWNRVAEIHPGSLDGYLESATIFWDYFQYKDSLRLISGARRQFHEPALFAYESGAIYEDEGDFSGAIDEYVAAALQQPQTGENASAQSRLLALARRKETAALVEQHTANLIRGQFSAEALRLRVAFLENQGRQSDIHALLSSEISRASTVSDAEVIEQSADHFGFDDTAGVARARRGTLERSSRKDQSTRRLGFIS